MKADVKIECLYVEWWSQIWQCSYFWQFFSGGCIYVCGLCTFTKKTYVHLNCCVHKMFVFPRMAESARIDAPEIRTPLYVAHAGPVVAP